MLNKYFATTNPYVQGIPLPPGMDDIAAPDDDIAAPDDDIAAPGENIAAPEMVGSQPVFLSSHHILFWGLPK